MSEARTPRTIALRTVEFFRQYPERHLIRYYARTKYGTDVEARDPDAYCFCFAGKMDSLTIDAVEAQAWRAALEVMPQLSMFGSSIVSLNDNPNLTLSEKLDVFEQIALMLRE